MDKLVYTAATGMRSHMAAQSAIANNMANASTIGFRADRVVFDRIDLKGGGAAFEARMPTAEEVTDADRAPGTVQHTGNPLDVAIATSSAWLAVQAPDGSEAYTRRGDLEVTASGVLQTGDGYPVIGQNGPITVPPYNPRVAARCAGDRPDEAGRCPRVADGEGAGQSAARQRWTWTPPSSPARSKGRTSTWRRRWST
ncbi:hypothetical protein SPKIRA_21480 [Sphingomonas paucimobilis]|nr:flagellar hook-basal body complex protein [Sphingomonas paucimobilis]BCI71318.1 hypothetical protein SPKIRA_21480 [Sphingomonas paucimobilis]